MSSTCKATEECNILPQAVVRVTDICKSPSEMRNEEGVRKDRDTSPRIKEIRDSSPRNKETRDSSPRNREIRDNISSYTKDISPEGRAVKDLSPRGKETRDISPRSKEINFNVTKNIFEVMEKGVSKKRHQKTSPNPKSKDIEESLRELKSESDWMRIEKSKKFNMEESPVMKLSPKQHIHGRRSPRHQSPNSSCSSSQIKNSNSPDSSEATEKPKINIFTDNIGKDLGKRVRSPRRLSEDMIPLPIYSLRKVGQSPKDNSGFSKYAEDGSNVGVVESVNTSDNIFKSPNDFSLCPSKKGSLIKSSEYADSFTRIDDDSRAGCSVDSNKNVNPSPSKEANKVLMSSICRDIMKEMTCTRRDIFMKGGDEKACGNGGDHNEKQQYGVNSVELKTEVIEHIPIGEAGDASDKLEAAKKDAEEGKQLIECNSSKESKELEPVKPSLLCAMLVGGTHVAEDYSQKRERYNPEVTEISDSETEQSRPVSPKLTTETQLVEGMVTDIKLEKSDVIDSKSDTTVDAVKTEIISEAPAEDLTKKVEVEPIKEERNGDASGSKNWKKKKIEFSSQLKKLNEDILKLLDIDVEDQFMAVPSTDEIIKEAVTEKETTLYRLISDLSVSLKEDSSISNVEEIDKIIQSCPKGSVPVVSLSFSEKKWESILDKLKNEKSELKKSRHRSKKGNMDADIETLVEKMSASSLQSVNEENNDIVCSEVKPDDTDFSKGVDMKNEYEKENDQLEEKKDILLTSLNNSEKVSEQNSCLMSTSSSSLNGSLCELDLDSITTAATQALKVQDIYTNAPSEPVSSGVSYNSEGLTGDNDKPNSVMKRKFQKSKTCGDFNQNSLPSTPSKPGTLRRTNSSPQLKADTLLQSCANSPNLKDQQVKSKLGGKIPIPGTSYSVKSMRKPLRKPRIIMDPKPHDVLLQFINDEKESKDVFISQDLQKFLWMPSNRMIVKPEIRNEINIADRTAEEAWTKKLQRMEEEEERQRKKDEEVDREYVKYEPDFDEVDGLLFMSFSSEIELQAHVRVEKALEWDKDDTMLRIARAKSFEETKAQNGDMKGVKMKRLRGQHMRWKKYKRMYGGEVRTILVAKEKNIPLEDIKILGKTSDVSKVKGWKRKSNLNRIAPEGKERIAPEAKDKIAPEAKENESTNISMISDGEMAIFNPSLNSTPECRDFETTQDMEDNIFDKLDKKDLSPRSRRRFNFSDRRAHKQLFKELNMDWEDRMIHRKLGGWSLKGNRPKQFSQAAKKRELKEIKALGLDVVSDKTSPGRCTDLDFDSSNKRRKLLFPLVTERLARSCLKTLELSNDVWGAVKRKKRKRRFKENASNKSISLPPNLLPTIIPSLTSTPQSCVATIGSSEKTSVSTPEASVSLSESTVLTASPSLSLDLPDESIIEGVEIVSQASSPVTDGALNSPQVKSCSKPGCRYGCICHLCSVNDVQSSLQSPVSKPSSRACNKEYCRLGCICDSLDPEQSMSSQSHCRKPSCMLECRCSSSGVGVEENEDIPYLASMRHRPRAGERFSNLPRREKTHRSAKNLDAVTRKAMMLYETSEIYCEKTERPTKKKSESVFSPPNQLITSPQSSTSSFPSQPFISEQNSTTSHCQQEEPTVDLSEQEPMASTVFSAVNLITSEVATVTASHIHSDRSQLFPWRPKKRHDDPVIDFEMDEVRMTRPIVEPSAHKRKRKSHPLSDEIFTVSSCARIQPYMWGKDKSHRSRVGTEKLQMNKQSELSTSGAVQASKANESIDSNPALNLKISSVCSLAEQIDYIEQNYAVPQKATAVMDLTVSKPCPGKDEKSLPTTDESSIFMSLPTVDESSVSKPCRGKGESSVSKSLPVTDDSSVKLDLSQSRFRDKVISSKNSTMQCGWHTSMVCLKARAAPKTTEVGEEDEVQEEDEVKLLEFAANCNWDRAKKEILSRVASCLTRGQYPQPRMMNIRGFMVEILPKAKQPSLIPEALRVKLPGQMYSIRVRITKRDDSFQSKDIPLIDLSKPSPVKAAEGKTNSVAKQSSVVKNLSDNSHSSSSPVPSTVTALTMTSLSSSTSSSSLSSSFASTITTTTTAKAESPFQSCYGISALNRIYINANNNTNNPSMIKQPSKPQSKSAPGSRRSSIENSKDMKSSQTSDDTLGANKIPPAKSVLDLGKMQIISNSNSLGASNIPAVLSTNVNNSSKDSILVSQPSSKPVTSISSGSSKHPNIGSVVTPVAFSPPQSINITKKPSSTATSLLSPGVALRKEKSSLRVPSFAVDQSKSANVNELKYVQMVYEVDGHNEKKKTLIAVPISLTGANMSLKGQSTLSTMPILTVPKPGLPVLAPRNKNKLPQVIPGAPIVMNMKLPQQINSTSKSEGGTNIKSMQIIPFSSVSSLLSNNVTKSLIVPPCTSTPNIDRPSSSGESIIINGDKSPTSVSVSIHTSVSKDMASSDEHTSVTQSLERPISSTEVLLQRDNFPTCEVNGKCCPDLENTTGNLHVSSEAVSNGLELEDTCDKALGDQITNSMKSKQIINKSSKNTHHSKDICNKISESVSTNCSKSEESVTESSDNPPIQLSVVYQPSNLTDNSNGERKSLSVIDSLELNCDKSQLLKSNVTAQVDDINDADSMQPLSSNQVACSESGPLECAASTNKEGSSIEESHMCEIQTPENKEIRPVMPTNESFNNTFEVVDMDDLLVSTSDELATSEFIDIGCSNSNSHKPDGNEQLPLTCPKRQISPGPTEDWDCPRPKKIKLLNEIPGILDDDSNLSLATASPQSYTSQQKSLFSSGTSSGSMEDVISSDEEIDVGEELASFQHRVEKAWENDHSSMFSKIPMKVKYKEMGHSKKKEEASKEPKDRGQYHNYLERNRRAKLKQLFDNLANVILAVRGPKNICSKEIDPASMPKATILTEAKSTILDLIYKDTKGMAEIQHLMQTKENLFAQLKELKAHLLTNNMSGRAIAAIINKVSRQKGKEAAQLNEPIDIKTECDLIEPSEESLSSALAHTSKAEDDEKPDLSVDTGDVVYKTEPSEDYELEFYPM